MTLRIQHLPIAAIPEGIARSSMWSNMVNLYIAGIEERFPAHGTADIPGRKLLSNEFQPFTLPSRVIPTFRRISTQPLIGPVSMVGTIPGIDQRTTTRRRTRPFSAAGHCAVGKRSCVASLGICAAAVLSRESVRASYISAPAL